MKKKKKLILAILILSLVVSIILVFMFVSDHNLHKPTNKVPDNNETNPIEDYGEVTIIDENSNSRPFAVMIDNSEEARKVQRRLQDADLVYEIIVEGGLTRIMAIYKDKDVNLIGPIRSSRHYYLDYALENDAIYVHWGYSEYAYSDINNLHINNLNGLVYGNTYFWKDNSLPIATEHRAYSSMELINKGIEKLGYRKTTEESPLLTYSATDLDIANMDGAIPANQVDIVYSKSVTSSYTYDGENKNYKRSVNNKAHTDYVTKEQYTAKNIITYQVNNYTISGDAKGRQNLENIGNGTGYYISDGYAVPITWEKASRSEKTIYKLKDGTPLTVNDGNTYIQIQPKGENLSIS